MMNVNTLSPIAITKAALPFMKKQKSGSIVMVNSIAGLLGVPVRTLYSASKFGLEGFSKSLRSEIKAKGINVTNIYPSYV